MCINNAIKYLLFHLPLIFSFFSLVTWICDFQWEIDSVLPGADLLDTSTRRLFQSSGTDLRSGEPKAKDGEPLDFLFQRPKVTSVHCSTKLSFNLTFRKSLFSGGGATTWSGWSMLCHCFTRTPLMCVDCDRNGQRDSNSSDCLQFVGDVPLRRTQRTQNPGFWSPGWSWSWHFLTIKN